MQKPAQSGHGTDVQVRGRPAQGTSPIAWLAGRHTWSAALALAVILAFVLRVIALGSKDVFADELSSLRFAQLNWTAFWKTLTTGEANMAGYYVLLRLWMRISDTVWFARMLSVAAAVATVPALYALGKKLFSRQAALFACLLLAVNTFHMMYSQAARGYSLAVLLVTLSGLYFVKNLREPTPGSAAGYVISSAAALYAHYFAIFVLLAQFFALLFIPRQQRVLGRQIRLMLVVGVLATPLLLFAAIHKTEPIFWVQQTSAKDVYHFLTYLTGSGVRFALALLALGYAGREWWRCTFGPTAERQQDRAWAFLFVVAWLLIPIGLTLFISHWKPVFSPRFLLVCLPAMLLLVGQGMASIEPRWASYAIVGLFLLSSVTALRSYYREPGLEDWKSATKYLSENVRIPDVIVVDPANRDVLEYSFRRSGQNLPTGNLVSTPQSALGKTDHIWIVVCHPTAHDKAPMASPNYESLPLAQFTGIQVWHYARSSR